MNVLNCLPRSAQPKAKQALHNIWQSETQADAEKAFDLGQSCHRTRRSKGCRTNPIESTFGTIRHRTRRSKGCLSRDGMLHMMFKLGLCAEKTWRRLRGFDYLAKVITGIKFKEGVEVAGVDQVAA